MRRLVLGVFFIFNYDLKSMAADEQLTVTASRLPEDQTPLEIPTVGRAQRCWDEFCGNRETEPITNSMPKWRPLPSDAKFDNDPKTIWKLFEWFKSSAQNVWGQISKLTSTTFLCRQNKTETEVFEYDNAGRVIRKEKQIDGLEYGYNCEK